MKKALREENLSLHLDQMMILTLQRMTHMMDHPLINSDALLLYRFHPEIKWALTLLSNRKTAAGS